ncbi:MAG: LysR family transcriptional regulator [Kangiellaceae bacterium]|nr:LysR family transcriptional regulator [Kangiellaceae bacterium]
MQMENWDDIRFFLAVSRKGTISAAAKSLKVNHTTVSRRINSLEDKLQSKLFERSKDGLVLTTEAEAVVKFAEEMENDAQAFNRKLLGQDIQLEGKLRLTLPDSISYYFLSDDFHKFNQQYPEIQLEIISSDSPLNLNALEADIAIRFTDNPPKYLIGRKVTTVDYAVYASKQFICNNPQINCPIVKALTWLDVEGRPLWLTKNFPDVEVGIRYDSVMGMLAGLRSGAGIAQIPCMYGELDPTLVRIPTGFVEPGWGLWVLHHVDLKKSSKVRAAYQYFSQVLINKLGQYSLAQL